MTHPHRFGSGPNGKIVQFTGESCSFHPNAGQLFDSHVAGVGDVNGLSPRSCSTDNRDSALWNIEEPCQAGNHCVIRLSLGGRRIDFDLERLADDGSNLLSRSSRRYQDLKCKARGSFMDHQHSIAWIPPSHPPWARLQCKGRKELEAPSAGRHGDQPLRTGTSGETEMLVYSNEWSRRRTKE